MKTPAKDDRTNRVVEPESGRARGDVAIEEADIVLMTNDLQKIADLANLSRKAYGP